MSISQAHFAVKRFFSKSILFERITAKCGQTQKAAGKTQKAGKTAKKLRFLTFVRNDGRKTFGMTEGKRSE